MDKKALAAALALGVTMGAGGKTALDAALGTAEAKPVAPFTHAVDLRRNYDGSNLHTLVYASKGSADAGYADIGQSKKCAPLSDALRKQLTDCMNAAAATCEW